MNEITLTSYNMGDVTEADFDGWVAFVTEELGREAGVAVEVDAAPFGRGGESDRVSADSADDERAIRLAMVELWERWCASEWDARVPQIEAWQIAALRTEAGAAGDVEQVALCDRAAAGDVEARCACARALRDAAAQS